MHPILSLQRATSCKSNVNEEASCTLLPSSLAVQRSSVGANDCGSDPSCVAELERELRAGCVSAGLGSGEGGEGGSGC